MRVIVIIFSLLILVSCAKDGKRIFVEGRVLNPVTGEGIKGMEVKALKNALDGGYTVLKETVTDANGNYELGFNSVARDVYIRSYGKAGYYKVGWDIDFETEQIDIGTFRIPKKGKVYKADYHTVPDGYFKLDIKNINCLNEDDTMIFKKKYEFGETNYWSSPRTGCYNYQTPQANSQPSGKYSYDLQITRNGITEYYYNVTTVEVSHLDTTIIQLYY